MKAVDLRRRVSSEQYPALSSCPPHFLQQPKLHEGGNTTITGCACENPVPNRTRKTGRMETVTVTMVSSGNGAGGCQGETEATTRERKISSKVRKISDALTNIVTLNHNNHHGQIGVSNGNGGGGCQGETEATTRERKISSKVRKISDALTNIVTLNHSNHHGPMVVGTLTSQNSVSLADLLKAEEQPDTRSISSGSIDFNSTGHGHHHNYHQNNLSDKDSGKGENGGVGPGHTLGKGTTESTGDNGKKWPQVVASIAANMGAFAFGAVLAWSATGITSMQDSEDLGELSNSISSWIGSIPTLGAVAACPFAGFALDTLGRKRSMLYLTVPFIVGWLLIGLAQNFFMVLLGRFVTGFCGGCFSIAAPIFTAETADASIRGGLGSLFDLLLSTGMLYIYVVGVFLPWRYQAIACAVIPVCFHIIMFFVPESPRYLVQKEKEHKAEKAIYWLKGNKINPEFVQKEMSDLKTSVGETKGVSASFGDALDRTLVMPTSILIGIMFFTTLSGIDAVIAYTVNIFESAGSTMDPKLSTIIIGIVTMLASFPTAAIVDIAGRRILLMASELVMATALGVMGLYFFMMRTDTVLFGAVDYKDVTWVPLACLVLFIIGYSLGCGPLSMMMIGELLPNRLKGVTSCIVLMTRWFLAFGVTNIFATLKETINDDGTYWLFASICFAGTFFVFFFVPETKGKSLAEIQLYFIGHKQNNIAIASKANAAKQQNNGAMHGYDNKAIDVDI